MSADELQRVYTMRRMLGHLMDTPRLRHQQRDGGRHATPARHQDQLRIPGDAHQGYGLIRAGSKLSAS